MRQGYFICNGVKYPTGTGIMVKDPTMDYLPREAYFVYWDDERNTYTIKKGSQFITYGKISFIDRGIFQGVNGKFNSEIHMPYTKQLKDLQIDKLVVGWIVYIAVMIGSIIFKDCISIWIFGSIYFYFWRKDVIKKEGHYMKWQ